MEYLQCDPDDFTRENGWSLRVSDFGRSTDLLIAVTSYNEVRRRATSSISELSITKPPILGQNSLRSYSPWRHVEHS